MAVDETIPFRYALEVWRSEEENARRLGTQKALVAGFPGAILALSGFTASEGQAVVGALREGSILAILSALFFALGTVSLSWSLIRSLGIRPVREPVAPLASVGLHPTGEEDLLGLISPTFPEEAQEDAVARLLGAARHLKEANATVSEALQRALEWLFSGIVFSVLAFLCYVLL